MRLSMSRQDAARSPHFFSLPGPWCAHVQPAVAASGADGECGSQLPDTTGAPMPRSRTRWCDARVTRRAGPAALRSRPRGGRAKLPLKRLGMPTARPVAQPRGDTAGRRLGWAARRRSARPAPAERAGRALRNVPAHGVHGLCGARRRILRRPQAAVGEAAAAVPQNF